MIATPVTAKSDFHQIALKAYPYFQQGLEMFLTSMSMNITSSPLVEYYSILQMVKGIILIDLDINENLLFANHGIVENKHNPDNKGYIMISVKPFGVFQSLLLKDNGKSDIDNYLSNNLDLTLSQLLGKDRLPEGIHFEITDIAPTFMESWMLSTLVRYRPNLWFQICQGFESDDILKIKKFREGQMHNSLNKFISGAENYKF